MKSILIILFAFIPFFAVTNGEAKELNHFNNPMVLEDVTIIGNQYPRLMFADSVINSLPISKNSVAWRQKNPGNLRSYYTGKYREFNNLTEGYSALLHQLDLYVTGKSMHTTKETTLEEYVHIYASEARTKEWYINVMVNGLKCLRSTKISELSVDSLAKYHIRMEDVELYKIMYEI